MTRHKLLNLLSIRFLDDHLGWNLQVNNLVMRFLSLNYIFYKLSKVYVVYMFRELYV